MKNVKILTRFILFILLNLIYSTSYCQQYEENNYTKQYEDMTFSELENALVRIKDHYKSITRVNSFSTIETIIDLSEKFSTQKDYYLKAQSYNLLGKIHSSNRDYEKALKNYKIAELFIEELKGHQELAIEVHSNIALTYVDGFNKPGMALRRIKRFYENYEDLDKKTQHIVALSLANIYLKITVKQLSY